MSRPAGPTADVTVRYFAAARELAGCSEDRVALPDATVSLSALRGALAERHAALRPHLPRMRFAVNGDLVDADALVRAGDEVDLLPPVAGGGEDPVRLCAIRERPLSVDECMQAVAHPGAGAVAVFTGLVRDHADGKEVARLDYEAHPRLADETMRRILREVADSTPGVRMAATHRVGSLVVGDLAVVVAASSSHRAEAFTACRLAIERIKETVPIWKKEWTPDGTAHWVNL